MSNSRFKNLYEIIHLKEREEREEIERELKAQQQAREAAAAALAVSNAGQLNLFRDTSGDGGSGENNNGTGSTTNVSSTGMHGRLILYAVSHVYEVFLIIQRNGQGQYNSRNIFYSIFTCCCRIGCSCIKRASSSGPCWTRGIQTRISNITIVSSTRKR